MIATNGITDGTHVLVVEDEALVRNLSPSPSDMRLIEPDLESSRLPLRKILEGRVRRHGAAYFLDSGFASVVANGNKRPIEVGLIGREEHWTTTFARVRSKKL